MDIMSSIGQLLTFFLGIYSWIILFRVLISWVNPDPYNPIVQLLIRVTEPVLGPLRRMIPSIAGIDFSPIVAFLGINMLQSMIHALFSSGNVGGAMMAILGQLIQFVYLIVVFYMLLLLVRGGINLYSWSSFRRGQTSKLDLRHPLARFIFQATEPAVRPLKRYVPTVFGLEISPFIAALLSIFVLNILQIVVAALMGIR
ncbi:YggT family protein [Magnetococcus sp. PR-3]|uniref:YggT family protein n=1 Tax=Magnetococcus sp. PR-3 TaxID=3120355 RepID=UPI002FCE5221